MSLWFLQPPSFDSIGKTLIYDSNISLIHKKKDKKLQGILQNPRQINSFFQASTFLLSFYTYYIPLDLDALSLLPEYAP